MGRKHDASFSNVNSLDYKINPDNPAADIIDFSNMHKRDKKNLEVISHSLFHFFTLSFLLSLF